MDVLKTKYVPLVRIHAVKERLLPYGQEEISSPERVVKMVNRLLDGADREYVLAIPVDTRNCPVGVEIVAIGALNYAMVQARELFKHAVLSNASGIIIVHNHPSGNPKPSRADWKLTRRMQEAGEILGIEVLDHIIVGERDVYVSMCEDEKWKKREKYA